LAAALTFASTTGASATSGDGGGPGGQGGPDQLITLSQTAQSSVEGRQVGPDIAAFTDPDPTASASQYTASVNWGDGSPSVFGTITRTAGMTSAPSTFTVAASHVYTDAGSFLICMRVQDVDNRNGASGCASANVDEAPMSVRGLTGALINPYCDAVATIADSNPAAFSGDYTTTIDWGDGTTSAGTVARMSDWAAGQFAVQGCHTYAELGPHTITTTVIDSASSITATGTAWVYAMTEGGTFVIGDGNAIVGNQVMFWGGDWASSNSLSGGSAPAAFKGFAPRQGSMCVGTWTAGPGGSSNPPASVPSYTAVLVSSSMTRQESRIDGNSIHVALVHTAPGYGSDPGQPGFGSVAFMIC
jgi:hypothetical protein